MMGCEVHWNIDDWNANLCKYYCVWYQDVSNNFCPRCFRGKPIPPGRRRRAYQAQCKDFPSMVGCSRFWPQWRWNQLHCVYCHRHPGLTVAKGHGKTYSCATGCAKPSPGFTAVEVFARREKFMSYVQPKDLVVQDDLGLLKPLVATPVAYVAILPWGANARHDEAVPMTPAPAAPPRKMPKLAEPTDKLLPAGYHTPKAIVTLKRYTKDHMILTTAPLKQYATKHVLPTLTPRLGFATAYGAMAACMVSRATDLPDVMYYAATCRKFQVDRPHGRCYGALDDLLIISTRQCCGPFDDTARYDEARKFCKKAMLKAVAPLYKDIKPWYRGECVPTPKRCAASLHAAPGLFAMGCLASQSECAMPQSQWKVRIDAPVRGFLDAAESLLAKARWKKDLTAPFRRILAACTKGKTDKRACASLLVKSKTKQLARRWAASERAEREALERRYTAAPAATLAPRSTILAKQAKKVKPTDNYFNTNQLADPFDLYRYKYSADQKRLHAQELASYERKHTTPAPTPRGGLDLDDDTYA